SALGPKTIAIRDALVSNAIAAFAIGVYLARLLPREDELWQDRKLAPRLDSAGEDLTRRRSQGGGGCGPAARAARFLQHPARRSSDTRRLRSNALPAGHR